MSNFLSPGGTYTTRMPSFSGMMTTDPTTGEMVMMGPNQTRLRGHSHAPTEGGKETDGGVVGGVEMGSNFKSVSTMSTTNEHALASPPLIVLVPDVSRTSSFASPSHQQHQHHTPHNPPRQTPQRTLRSKQPPGGGDGGGSPVRGGGPRRGQGPDGRENSGDDTNSQDGGIGGEGTALMGDKDRDRTNKNEAKRMEVPLSTRLRKLFDRFIVYNRYLLLLLVLCCVLLFLMFTVMTHMRSARLDGLTIQDAFNEVPRVEDIILATTQEFRIRKQLLYAVVPEAESKSGTTAPTEATRASSVPIFLPPPDVANVLDGPEAVIADLRAKLSLSESATDAIISTMITLTREKYPATNNNVYAIYMAQNGGRVHPQSAADQLLLGLLEAQSQLAFFARPQFSKDTTLEGVITGSRILQPSSSSPSSSGTLRSRILIPMSRAYVLVTRRITRNVDWGGLTGTITIGGNSDSQTGQIGWALILRDMLAFGSQLFYMVVPPGSATPFDSYSSGQLPLAPPTTTTSSPTSLSSSTTTETFPTSSPTSANSFNALKMVQFNSDLTSYMLTRTQEYPAGDAVPRVPSGAPLPSNGTPNTATWNDMGLVIPARIKFWAKTYGNRYPWLLSFTIMSNASIGNVPYVKQFPLRTSSPSSGGSPRISDPISNDIRSQFREVITSISNRGVSVKSASQRVIDEIETASRRYYGAQDSLLILSIVAPSCMVIATVLLCLLLVYHDAIKADDRVEEKFLELETSLKLIPKIAAVMTTCTVRDAIFSEYLKDAKLVKRLLRFLEVVRPYIQQSLFGEVESLTATHQQNVAGGAITALSSGANAVSKLLNATQARHTTPFTPSHQHHHQQQSSTNYGGQIRDGHYDRMNIAESGGGSVAHATSTSGVGDGDATQQQQTSGVLGEDDTSSLQAPKSTGIGEFGGAGAMIAEVLSKKRYAEFNMGYRVKQRAQAIDATEVIENSGSGDIYEDEGGFEVNATETPRSGGHGDPNRSSSFIAKSAILANVGGGALYSGVPGLEFQSLSVSGGAKTAFGRGGVAISGAVGGAAASGHRRMNALTTVDFRLTDIAMSQAFRELHMRDLRRESTMHICSGVVMMISSPLLCTVPSTSDWDYTPPPSNFNNNGNAAVHGNNQHGTPPASATDDVLSPNLPPAARRRGARRGVQEDATADRALEMSYHQEARDRSFAAIRSGDIDLTYDKAHRQGGGHLNQHAASPGRGAAGGNGDGEDGQEGGDDDREEGGLCAKGTCLYQFLNGTDDDAEEGVSQSQLGSMERFHLRTAEKLRNRAAAVSNATGSSNTNKNNGVGPTSAPVTTKRAENILLTTERDDWKTLETARMNKFIQVIEDSVNGSGGVIHSVAGDAIIAVWNVNNSSTKPVASASLAAFSIQRRVQALMSSQLFSSLMLPPATLPVTIALGTSYVIAGNVKLGNQGRVSMLLAGPGVVSCSNLLNASQQHRSPIVIDNASVNQLSSLTFADYDHCLRPIGISIPTSEVNRIRKLRREGSGFGVSRSTAFQSSTLDGLGLKRSGKADTNSGSTPAGNSHSDSLIELKGTAAAAPPTESFHKSKLSVDSSSLQHAFKEDSEVDVRSMYDYLEEHNYIVYSLYPARIMRSEKLRQWHATFREMVVLYVCREDYDGAIKVLQRYRVEHCGASPDERPTASGTIITGTTIPTPLVAPPGPSSPFSASLATKVDHTADVWLEKLLKGADQARIRGVLRDRAVRQQAAAAAAVAAANTTSGRKLKKSKSKHLKVESSDQNALS